MIQRPAWQLGFSDKSTIKPESYFEAIVPGAVQLDMIRKENMSPYTYASNVLKFQWMHAKFWHYTSSVHLEKVTDKIPYLIFDSIEYQYEISINNSVVKEGKGIYTPVRIDLSEHSGDQIKIDVLIYPAPVYEHAKKRNDQFSRSCKPPFAFGWDWSPRLIALGLCGDVRVEYLPMNRITDFDISYSLNEDFTEANISVCYSLSSATAPVIFELIDPSTGRVIDKSIDPKSDKGTFNIQVKSPQLWWPSGQGGQPIYTAKLTLLSDTTPHHTVTRKIGFRRVRLVTNEGTWFEQEGLPATQNKEPITAEINGRRIFAKGSNLVPFDMFPSQVSEDDYLEMIRLVKDANMNILRVWGGGYVHKESFYDICDEQGILIWQEFPLSCSSYPDDPDYLKTLEQEARSIIRKLIHHPSVTIWSGGNELFNNWSGMTSQSLALRLLNSICLELDPHTPFIYTSPLFGMGHGHYLMLDSEDHESLTTISDSKFTAYTEFGCASPSPWEYIKTFIPGSELNEPAPSGSWEIHHAFKAWHKENTWMSLDQIERFYGDDLSLPDLCSKGNLLQTLLYRYLYEEMRKHWPYTSMALNWCLNEPWPTAAGNSLLNYPAEPKPAYYGVKEALREQKYSIRIRKLLWNSGEEFRGDLWILNTSPYQIESGKAEVKVVFDEKTIETYVWEYEEIRGLKNLKGPDFVFAIPDNNSGSTEQLEITIRSLTGQNLDSSYVLLVK